MKSLDTSQWEAAYCYEQSDKEFNNPTGDLMPWTACSSDAQWVLCRGGIPPGHEEGILGQFPDVDWRGDLDPVMEQIWAIGLGHADVAVPGFRKDVRYLPLRAELGK